mmetsp:Transcript_19533/g.42144  ORF Transcript_19533/g.42144 Transcript_19533/m.42144 type:complete len:195 (-) Transcript_19533:12-596(-)
MLPLAKPIRYNLISPDHPSPDKSRNTFVTSACTASMAEAEQELREFVRSFNNARLDISTSPPTEVKTKFADFCQEFGIQDDVFFIRPSGNPATPETLLAMIESGETEYTSQEIRSIDLVRTFCDGNGAVVTFTQHAKFIYKGKNIEDIAMITVVLEKDEESQHKWKLVHSHRSPGRRPVAVGQKRNRTIRQQFV